MSFWRAQGVERNHAIMCLTVHWSEAAIVSMCRPLKSEIKQLRGVWFLSTAQTVIAEFCPTRINSVRVSSMIKLICMIVLKKDWWDLPSSLWGEKTNRLAKRESMPKKPPRHWFHWKNEHGNCPKEELLLVTFNYRIFIHCFIDQKDCWFHTGKCPGRWR